MSFEGCPFCCLPKERIWLESDAGIAFRDGYPVSEGHSLVVPRRHVASLFELNETEYADLWQLVARVRAELNKEFKPDAFNVGINDGAAAGQTVPHAHIHLIPRRKGDVEDPRGGVRWVVPDKADYWTKR
jgi:diadenosine tetraphosphate (Ap4A) HIT family hydrolase